MQRAIEPELMDDPALDAEAHRRALRGLRRLNGFSASAACVWRAIEDLARSNGFTEQAPMRVLDVASGGGDVAIGLARRAAKAELAVQVEGCDLSETAIEFAREAADAAMVDVEFFALNALVDPIPTGYDVVTCSLFLHHLRDDQAERLLRRLAGAAKRRVVVNDVARGRLNAALIWVGARLLGGGRVVRVDAMRSIRAALTPDEAMHLVDRAGLTGARITRRFPCRMVMTWDKP